MLSADAGIALKLQRRLPVAVFERAAEVAVARKSEVEDERRPAPERGYEWIFAASCWSAAIKWMYGIGP